jgi:hypothetical protein
VPSLDDDDAGCRAVGAEGGGADGAWPPRRGNRLCPPHY